MHKIHIITRIMNYDMMCSYIGFLLESVPDKMQKNIFDMMVHEYGKKFKYIATNTKMIVRSDTLSDEMLKKLYDTLCEYNNEQKKNKPS